MNKILLKNGEVVSSEGTLKIDVLIEDGKIVGFPTATAGQAEEGEEVEDAEVVDCMDKLILPGVVDPHVHFRDPGATYKEDFESGSRAAVSGGVTTVLDMPNNEPPTTSRKALDDKRALVSGRSYVNYGFYIGYDGGNLEEVNEASNIPGVKVFVANSTGDMGVGRRQGPARDGIFDGVGTKNLEELFEKSNKLIVVHAEDEGIIEENKKKFDGELTAAIHSQIRSPEAAAVAVKYVCELARKYKRPVHIAHVSTEAEVDIIEEYKDDGVTCEVTPHHLHLTEDDYEHWKNFIKVNPPVRSRMEVFALWKALKMGVIDIIDTDHAPHSLEEKEAGYLDAPAGIPGVEMLLPIFLNTVSSEGLTISELVKLVCERPAEIFGIPNKGRIVEGYDADLVIVDMELEKKVERGNLLSKAGWSPYEGLMLKGWPIMTIVNGEIVYKDGKIEGKPIGKEVVFF
ncbi:MAG: amidohydrolase family protein [Nitrospirae bacterium]|nr:amidohydrolase family protein [Nitrospirota bacterium]